MICAKCHSQLPETSRFCLTCGAAVSDPGDMATIAIDETPSSRLSTPKSVTSASRVASGTAKSARFAPGTMLSGRYQIVGLLGKGGMGEVYRANDLTLDQPVALKFLPESMAQNPAMLARFHGEVRIARQVSHPNVCRVYDVGEVEGQLFLSMEYIDGEDLSSLLRRIGRLPADKGIEFARKICAGLAAAHDKGILHRDLKPSNIMIDSNGQVVVMDFGLAGIAGELGGSEISAGTPAYMSPEQLSGTEVTVRSDIYALGLLLYEMFTGKRPFEGNSLAEMIELQARATPVSLTTVVKDVDPVVERVILRCIAPDPKLRPTTALAVAAALPGGDPLAAALAAGETPSPDLVAASGETAGIQPMKAFAWAAAAVIFLIATIVAAPMATLFGRAPLDIPPDGLAQKARDVLQSIGYTQKPVDTAQGFDADDDYAHYVNAQGRAPSRWQNLGTGIHPALYYWYRQSPRFLEPASTGNAPVSPTFLPATVSGMTTVLLDPRGHLLSLDVVPPQVDASPPSLAPIDWKPLFAAAGLDPGRFKETTPTWTPLFAVDARAAWTGTVAAQPGVQFRVEAGAWRGRPVFFKIVAPWTRPERMQPFRRSFAGNVLEATLLTFALGGMIGGGLLALYNLKRGRGDRRGALRVALFTAAVDILIWVFAGVHTPTAGEVARMFTALAMATFLAAVIWGAYLAVEPYVRRHWPQAIISWTRLLAGGLRDPLVGRDLLIGAALGCFWGAIWALGNALDVHLGDTPVTATRWTALLGTRYAVATTLMAVTGSIVQLLVCFLLLFLCRLLVRRQWLAAALFVLIYTVFGSIGSATLMVDIPLSLGIGLLIYFSLTRFGLVAFVTSMYVFTLFVLLPITSDFSAWYSGPTILALAISIALIGYGLLTVLRGRSILKDELL
jgi:predicted Ser/Thr protein kinase